MKTSTKTITLIISLQLVVTVNAWTNHQPSTNNCHVSLNLRKRRKSDRSSTMLYERAGAQDWEEPSQSLELQRASLEQSLNPMDLFRNLNHVNDGIVLDNTIGHDAYEQCEIPDQFKINDCSGMDVMAFLGIRRAAPLVDYEQRFDWE
mmetsp:Transcript_13188/g.18907  ORF Transcript_13188/g.18907 Transcript_13188/m.18907 type:complete len:148 (+) Transcript_13188:112-555(+)